MLNPDEEKLIAAIRQIIGGLYEVINVIVKHADERYTRAIVEANKKVESRGDKL